MPSIFLLFTLALLGWSLTVSGRLILMACCYRRTVGRVTGYRETPNQDDAEDSAYWTTATFEDARGRRFKAVTAPRASFFRRRPGDPITVYYREDDPNDARAVDAFDLLRLVSPALVLAGACAWRIAFPY